MSGIKNCQIFLICQDEQFAISVAMKVCKILAIDLLVVSAEIEKEKGKNIENITKLLGEHEVHNLEAKWVDALAEWNEDSKSRIVVFSKRIVLDPKNISVISNSKCFCLWLDVNNNALSALGQGQDELLRYSNRKVLFAEVADAVVTVSSELELDGVVDEICKKFTDGVFYAN
jgi:shikimate kinase